MTGPVQVYTATVGGFADGAPGISAVCEEIPDIVGHGADQAEAVEDMTEQLEAITWH